MANRLEIRTRARIRADQTNSTKPTDTEYNYFIDEACKRTWADLIQAGWPIDYTAASITATGAATYVIGTGVNIFGVNGVFYSGAGQVRELKRVNQGDVAALRASTSTAGLAEFYEVRMSPTQGFVIELFPRVTTGVYEVRYNQDHPGLASDVAVWYGPNRSDELVVLEAAAKGLRNEGMDRDAWVLEKEREKLLELVKDVASWSDMRNSAMIREVREIRRVDGFDYDVARSDW